MKQTRILPAMVDSADVPLNVEKMKALRIKLEMSQDQAASLAGLAGGRQRWNDIESGRRMNVNLDTLDRIAKALGCKAADLLK